MNKLLCSALSLSAFVTLAACGPPTEQPDVRTDSGTPSDSSMNMPETSVMTDVVVAPTDADAGPPAACGADYTTCNPVANTGCMAGQACVVTNPAMRMSMCVTAGRAAFGAACMTAEDCQEGLGCLSNRCARWCCGAGDNTACRTGPGSRPGAICNINVNNSGLFACSLPSDCNLHQQNCPTAMDNCILAGNDGTVQCVTPTAGAVPGRACMFLNDCPRGYLCIGTMGTSTCRQVCDPTMMATGDFSRCAAPMTCGRLTGAPMNVGVCGTPMMM
ncbi:MAG: hypothetical protein Q8Q09_04185 [Deltaproteobacteria bacterium]|nr:hypothetical protein [Deltaproteobacteria bacterium]